MARKESLKKGIYSTVAGAMTLYSTGCATMNYDIKPHMSVNGNSDSGIETLVGVSVEQGNKNSLGKEVFNTIRSPFYIRRSSDGKWFPEWKEHPVRTSAMTAGYIGLAVLATQGGGSSKSKPEPVYVPEPTRPSTRPAPSEPEPAPSAPAHTPAPEPAPVPNPGDGGY